MRLLALLLTVSIASVATAAPAKSRPAPKKKAPPPPAPKPAPQPSRPSEPARAKARPASPEALRLAFGVTGGWAYGGGLNRGPMGTVQVSFTPPGWGRLSVDAELGWRHAAFSTATAELGFVTSSAHAIPLYGVARLEVLDGASFRFDVRGGIGPMFAVQHLASEFSASTLRTSLGWDAFVGAQARIPVSSFEVLLDGRFALGEAYVPFVVGRASGVQASVGVRYVLP